MITIEQLITRIEQRQPIINKAEIDTEQLCQPFSSVGSLTTASQQQLSFLADPHYISSLASSDAGAVLVTEAYRDQVPTSAMALVVSNPYLAYASASQLFARHSLSNGIHPSAVISESAVIGGSKSTSVLFV